MQKDCFMPVHGRTLTGWVAEEAAADMASDCRELIKEGIKIGEAIAAGDASEADRKAKELIDSQIRSYCSLIFVNELGEEFPVRSYVTARQGILMQKLRSKIASGYERIKKVLH